MNLSKTALSRDANFLTIIVLSLLVFSETHAQQPKSSLLPIVEAIDSDINLALRRIYTLIPESAGEFKQSDWPIYALALESHARAGQFSKAAIYHDYLKSTLGNVKDAGAVIKIRQALDVYYGHRNLEQSDLENMLEIIKVAAEHDFQSALGHAHIDLGFKYINLGATNIGSSKIESGIALLSSSSDELMRHLGMMYMVDSAINSAAPDFEQIGQQLASIETYFSQHGKKRLLGFLYRVKALYWHKQGEYEKADEVFEKAYEIEPQVGSYRLSVVLRMAQIYAYQARGDLERAIEVAEYGLNLVAGKAPAVYEQRFLKDLSDLYFQKKNSEKHGFYLNELQKLGDYKRSTSLELVALVDKASLEYIQSLEQLKIKNAEVLKRQQLSEQLNLMLAVLIVVGAFGLYFYFRWRSGKIKLDLSMKDPITGAYQRVFLNYNLPAVESRYNRRSNSEQDSTGVIILDCDHFKSINDNHGHDAGDKVLAQFATIINNNIRENDLLIRWGGDEFLVICEGIGLSALRNLSERLRFDVEACTFEYQSELLRLTCSVGYALHESDKAFNFEKLVKIADQHLYQSKAAGRNKVIGGMFVVPSTR